MYQGNIQIERLKDSRRNPGDLVLAALGLFAVAGIGSYVTSQSISSGWYQNLNLPAIQPPSVVFGVAWTILYILLFVSYALVRRKAEEADYDYQALLGVNLLVNLAWTLVFFGFQQIVGGILVLCAYIAVCIGTAKVFSRYNLIAAILQIPLILWTIFALILNVQILSLN